MFVATYQGTYGVEPLLAEIGEPVSTYYDQLGRGPSKRAVGEAALLERNEAIWIASRQSYGAPRIHAMLAAKTTGWAVSDSTA